MGSSKESKYTLEVNANSTTIKEGASVGVFNVYESKTCYELFQESCKDIEDDVDFLNDFNLENNIIIALNEIRSHFESDKETLEKLLKAINPKLDLSSTAIFKNLNKIITFFIISKLLDPNYILPQEKKIETIVSKIKRWMFNAGTTSEIPLELHLTRLKKFVIRYSEFYQITGGIFHITNVLKKDEYCSDCTRNSKRINDFFNELIDDIIEVELTENSIMDIKGYNDVKIKCSSCINIFDIEKSKKII